MPGNILKPDEIGDLTGFVDVPYSFGNNAILDHLNTSYYHVHGQSFCYPTTADDVTLTAGGGAWGTGGAITEVIPANTLDVSAFDLHWVNISNQDDNAYYYIEIYAGPGGSETLIGSTRSWADSTFFGGQIATGTKRIQIPQQPKNTRISCKLYSGDAGASTLNVSFEGHYYA